MSRKGLNKFINILESKGELRRVRTFVDPVLEITEVADRVFKNGGPALLFENNGTSFPLLINAFGSAERVSLAIGHHSLGNASKELEAAILSIQKPAGSFMEKMKALPRLAKLAAIMPRRTRSRGRCQQVVIKEPDLGILPVLKCWPHDGGPFITLPIVHTKHPVTGAPNAGMYRMQILGRDTTGMHWQLHKTGASHFNAWKETGRKMPVSVALGGDPVYTYAATAPLPENIDEYMLAGFLRGRKVNLVKCITNDIHVPEDADIVIEGYVDPLEEPVWEGPFGDHTGFYSLADWYPRFHVTCITHARDAVYPATIVGIPPMEDEFLAMATEKIFLPLIRLALLPEVVDLHMPSAGVAHNLAIVKINKKYPGQALKVISSLTGAGQMMFTKYLVVVSGDIDIRDYKRVIAEVIRNAVFPGDLVFTRGPLDVLDHSSDTFAFGGKMGIDATKKVPGEGNQIPSEGHDTDRTKAINFLSSFDSESYITGCSFPDEQLPIVFMNVKKGSGVSVLRKLGKEATNESLGNAVKIIILADSNVSLGDSYMVAWQLFGNSDPIRDHVIADGSILVIDATMKAFREGGFPRRWPNIVISDESTIAAIDSRWNEFSLGGSLESPSRKYSLLRQNGNEEVTV
ncbi:MAG: menaquinone biosynthesis decarboxylase [Bacteroidales bacterium]